MPCGTDQRACNLPAATPPQYQVLKRREHFKLLSNIISNFRSIKEGVKNKARSILKICKNDYRFLFILIFLISIFPQFFVFSFLFRFLSCPSPIKTASHYSDLYSTPVCYLALYLVNYGISSLGSAWVMPKFSFLSCPSRIKAARPYSDLYSSLVGSSAIYLVNYGIFSLGSTWVMPKFSSLSFLCPIKAA